MGNSSRFGFGPRWAIALFALGALVRPASAETAPVLQAPEPVLAEKATYPPEAVAQKLEGTVEVVATVRKDGVVQGAKITRSSGVPTLDQAALSAALKWRFRPATSNGMPIESDVRIPFHFHLAEHSPNEHAPTPPPSADPPPASTPTKPPAAPTKPSAAPPPPAPKTEPKSPVYESKVAGRKQALSRGASDYHVDIEKLSLVPRQNAASYLQLAPGILLTNEGGEGHAEQVFLRGFDAREGQDIEFTVDGVPINESGNLHGNGYSDTHFIIPELIESLRVVEGPFDPRQGNFAVAGSADFHLGLHERGITTKFSAGNFGSYRLLLTFAPPGGSSGTFAAAEYYQTNGFGQNRDGRRGTVMAQYEGHVGSATYRITATGFLSSFHSAGVLRNDDYRSGRVGFYDTYDPLQGEDASRYSLAAELETRAGRFIIKNQVFGIARPLRIRENFTGFLLDVQTPQQKPHDQRGDLIDLNVMEWTLGAHGSARLSGLVFKQMQELEIGYYVRGDFVSSRQQRIEAQTGHPYHTDADLDSKLGDIGLYADANLRFLRWLALRGGLRGDLFTYQVNDLCAVQSVEHPSTSNGSGDSSCQSQENFGAYRDPNQYVSTVSAAFMPRGSLILGPFWGLGASASAGLGVRSIDPQYITQDARTQFVSVTAYEGGLTFNRRLFDRFDLSLRSVVFYTKVDRDLIFSETVGRNILSGATTRLGSASSLRLTGSFYDLAANVTYVRARFEDTHYLIPYVPDLVVRGDGVLFGELPWRRLRLRDRPLRASLGAGVTYVGPRPLPYGERSDTIVTVDSSASIGWWIFDLGVGIQNLLDHRYRLGEFNYASDFHTQSLPTLVPVRHFTAGAPRTVLFSLSVNLGGQS